MSVIIVIPAYEPENHFYDLCRDIINIDRGGDLVVVDDGSGVKYRELFDKIAELSGVTVLRHYTNLGKGRALKTAFNCILNEYPEGIGVVTADSDGQHQITDIEKVIKALSENPDDLILGCRTFHSTKIPKKSKVGNELTKIVFHYATGVKVSDTQTGLRGIPRNFMSHLLGVSGEKFEFETNMLIESKTCGIGVYEVPIQTVYESKTNHKTHFDPIKDSVRIYAVLLAYTLSSFFSALLDFAVFSFSSDQAGISIWKATAAARLCACAVNFSINKKSVFKAGGNTLGQAVRYLLLVAVSGIISASCISFLAAELGINTILSKIIIETILFFFNFYIQRTYIFVRDRKKDTDWTAYYRKRKSWFSRFTQQYTIKELLTHIRDDASVLELGGGNSCFAEDICKKRKIIRYDIVDNNRLAVEMFEQIGLNTPAAKGYLFNLLDGMKGEERYDFVYSVGLIEHFQGSDIAKIIERHFEYCKPDGTVLITFPTPTRKYRLCRKCMELFGVWQFWDENPLKKEDVDNFIRKYGSIMECYINQKLPLTQMIVVAKKNGQKIKNMEK